MHTYTYIIYTHIYMYIGEELWGLTINPIKDQFCTVGDDAFLKIWDLLSHSVVTTLKIEMSARCCAYSPDGLRIAVGFGSPIQTSNKQYDGKWVVLDADDGQVVHEARDSTKWLTEAKYSPNGELLAFGSVEGTILIYNVTDNYSLNAIVNQHHASITSIDFSEDSKWMQSNCAAFELCFFEAETGLFFPVASRCV
jgi:microtubule-associated protein-like 6